VGTEMPTGGPDDLGARCRRRQDVKSPGWEGDVVVDRLPRSAARRYGGGPEQPRRRSSSRCHGRRRKRCSRRHHVHAVAARTGADLMLDTDTGEQRLVFREKEL